MLWASDLICYSFTYIAWLMDNTSKICTHEPVQGGVASVQKEQQLAITSHPFTHQFIGQMFIKCYCVCGACLVLEVLSGHPLAQEAGVCCDRCSPQALGGPRVRGSRDEVYGLEM